MRLHRTPALPIVVLALAAGGGGTDDSSTDPVLRTSGVLPSAGGALTVDGASLTLPDAAQPFWVGGDDLVLAAATRSGDRFSLTFDSLGFGPETADGEDSLRFSDVGTTTALSEGSEHLSGNAVVGSAALPSFDACSSFLRQHLKPMEARLFTSEHVISCTQRVTLSRLLQRE